MPPSPSNTHKHATNTGSLSVSPCFGCGVGWGGVGGGGVEPAKQNSRGTQTDCWFFDWMGQMLMLTSKILEITLVNPWRGLTCNDVCTKITKHYIMHACIQQSTKSQLDWIRLMSIFNCLKKLTLLWSWKHGKVLKVVQAKLHSTSTNITQNFILITFSVIQKKCNI